MSAGQARKKAEKILFRLSNPVKYSITIDQELAMAQVHATLAVAEAIRDARTQGTGL